MAFSKIRRKFLLYIKELFSLSNLPSILYLFFALSNFFLIYLILKNFFPLFILSLLYFLWINLNSSKSSILFSNKIGLNKGSELLSTYELSKEFDFILDTSSFEFSKILIIFFDAKDIFFGENFFTSELILLEVLIFCFVA